MSSLQLILGLIVTGLKETSARRLVFASSLDKFIGLFASVFDGPERLLDQSDFLSLSKDTTTPVFTVAIIVPYNKLTFSGSTEGSFLKNASK